MAHISHNFTLRTPVNALSPVAVFSAPLIAEFIGWFSMIKTLLRFLKLNKLRQSLESLFPSCLTLYDVFQISKRQIVEWNLKCNHKLLIKLEIMCEELQTCRKSPAASRCAWSANENFRKTSKACIIFLTHDCPRPDTEKVQMRLSEARTVLNQRVNEPNCHVRYKKESDNFASRFGSVLLTAFGASPPSVQDENRLHRRLQKRQRLREQSDVAVLTAF